MTDVPSREVTGSVIIGAELDSFSNASLRVLLEDVTLQDVSAEIVAETVVAHVDHAAGIIDRHAFRLTAAKVDERASYAVRAHVDLNGNREVDIGDSITMESYPVLTFGHPVADLSLVVKTVK